MSKIFAKQVAERVIAHQTNSPYASLHFPNSLIVRLQLGWGQVKGSGRWPISTSNSDVGGSLLVTGNNRSLFSMFFLPSVAVRVAIMCPGNKALRSINLGR